MKLQLVYMCSAANQPFIIRARTNLAGAAEHERGLASAELREHCWYMVIETALKQEVVLGWRVAAHMRYQLHWSHLLPKELEPRRRNTQPLGNVGNVGNCCRDGHKSD